MYVYMDDCFEILNEYDIIIADKLAKLELEKLGFDSSIDKNIKVLRDNNWIQLGEFLFYITLEKQSLKKFNAWIDVRTGSIADEDFVQKELIKYYTEKGFSQYKSSNLLYKWETQENHNPARIWIDSLNGLSPILIPMDNGEGDYIGDKSEQKTSEEDNLLTNVSLRKRYINEINEDEEKDICNIIFMYIKSIFI